MYSLTAVTKWLDHAKEKEIQSEKMQTKQSTLLTHPLIAGVVGIKLEGGTS